MNGRYQSFLANFILAAGIGAGLIVGAHAIADAIKQFRLTGRYVTVKGLDEREVIADVAIWRLRFKSANNDLASANTKALSDIKTVQDFLIANGISPQEIEIRAPRVIDLYTREYGPDHTPPSRFIIEAMMIVKTSEVTTVENAAKRAIDLIKAGVVLDENSYGSPNPSYVFTKLNDIRPSMLAQATKSARSLAEQFAADSGSKVGPIRQANQGIFTIGSDIESDESGSQASATVKKRVRVVSTIDYFLVD